MTILKRLFSLRVIGLVALMLFIVASYFATRKVLASDIWLGMDRKALINLLGKPPFSLPYSPPDKIGDFSIAVWNKTVLSSKIFSQTTTAYLNGDGKVFAFENRIELFGYKFCFVKGFEIMDMGIEP